MTCNGVRENLVAYIHGELEKKTVLALHQHLSECEACVQEEIELRQINRLLDQYQFEALPDNFDERLHQKLRKFEHPRQKEHNFRRIVYAIAATIVITLGLQFFGSRLFQSQQPPIHLKDFPTTQAVFKSAESSAEPSLKERMIQRYFQTLRE